MGIVIGIDVGISTTKIVGINGNHQVVAPICIKATDPVTSAQTECGKWIYGFLIGALCVVVRLFNPGYAEGMMLAILLMNTFAPLIDYIVTSRAMSKRAKKADIA